jgi:type I restriction-modification system DNA methylase subunit
MPAFQCEKCLKIFNLKTDLERHKKKLNPCIEVEKLISEKVEKLTENKIKNNEDINKVKKFLDFCHNTLRDKEGIVGMKALSNISMMLFLRFVNNSVKNGNIDLLNIEKYRKEEGSAKDEKFQMYKKYIKYCLFENIIENGKLKVDVEELIFIIEYIFKHVLWFHPKTKKIFADEFPSIKNEVTYEQILKQMDKINWDEIDIDVKGTAYEHFLKSEMGGGDLGQFFTRREIVDYMINIIKPNIKETSTFIDPFMGTGGFVTHMFNEIRNIYNQKKIPFTEEIKNKITNGIERNPQTCLLALNNLLLNMDTFPTNINCDDSFRNYINEKYDFVLTNPPFGIKGLMYDNESMFPKVYKDIKKKEYLPIKSNDAICLSMQMIPYILKKNGICAMVVPDGKQITSEKEKSIVEIRKKLIENNNLFQITYLPSGCFLPYTNVACCVLFFKKGEKTQNIKFIKLDDNYKTEKMLCNVNISKLIERNYSLNYKLYVKVENKYKNIEYKKLSDICELKNGKNITKDNLINGLYPVVGGGQKALGYHNEYNLDENEIIMSKDGEYAGYISMYDRKIFLTGHGIHIKILDICIEKKYLYHYLKHIQTNLYEYQKGSAQPGINKDSILNLQIPIPPIEVQNLIVQELDSMYKQKESLQNANNEMNTFRKVQFEMLLSNCKDVKEEKLGNIVIKKVGKSLSKDNMIDGLYPVIGGGEKISGLHNEYNCDEKIICIARVGSAGHISMNMGKCYITDLVGAYTIVNNSFNFVFYTLKNQEEQIKKNYVRQACAPSINLQTLMDNFIISLPSLKDQEVIVQQMEKYDELVKLQQAQIDEIDKTIKARFEFHLNKCKNAKPIKEDEISNKSSTKSENQELDELEELEKDTLKTKKTRQNIKILEDEKSNKSTKTQEEYEQIMYKDNIYINLDSKIYTIKDNKPDKLFGYLTPEGKLRKKPIVQKQKTEEELEALLNA